MRWVCLLALFIGCSSQPDVRIGVLWEGSEADDVQRAVQHAIDAFVKERSLTVFRPVMTAVTSASTSLAVTKGLCSLLQQGDLIGVVGMETSNNGLFAGFQAQLHNLPVISPSITVAGIDAAPSFMRRTIPDNAAAAQALPAILSSIAALKSASVAVIYSADFYGEDLSSAIRDAMYDAGRGVNLMAKVNLSPSAADLEALFTLLSGTHAEVVVVAASQDVAYSVLKEAAKQTGAFTLGHAWFVMDSMTTQDIPAGIRANVTGLLGVRPRMVEGQRYFELGAIWGGAPPAIARLAFDAAWALLSAAEATNAYRAAMPAKDCNNIAPSEKWQYGQLMMDHIDTMRDAPGATGPLTLNPSQKSVSFDVVNYRQKWSSTEWKEVGICDVPPNAAVTCACSPESSISWPGGKAPSPNQLLIGQHLRILFIIFPPFVSVKNGSEAVVSSTFPGELHIEGIAVDLLVQLATELEFTFSAETQVGGWEGGLHKVAAKEYDMQAADTGITYRREGFVDFTQPYMETTSILVVTSPTLENDLFRFALPFERDLWIVIGSVIVFVAIALYFLENFLVVKEVEDRGGVGQYVAPKGKYSVENSLWFACTAFLNVQAGEAITRAGRVFTLAFYWLSVVTIATYTAELAAFLARRTPIYAVNSIDEFKSGAHPASKLSVTPDTVNERWLRSNIPGYINVSTEIEQTQKTQDGVYLASVQDSIWAEWYVGVANSEGVCPYEVRGTGWNPRGVGLALQKGSPYTTSLSEKILDIRESGKLAKIKQKWYAGNCSADATEQEDSLLISDFGGVFLLYGGMVVMAIFWRVAKICLVRHKAKKVVDEPEVETLNDTLLENTMNTTIKNTSLARFDPVSKDNDPPLRIEKRSLHLHNDDPFIPASDSSQATLRGVSAPHRSREQQSTPHYAPNSRVYTVKTGDGDPYRNQSNHSPYSPGLQVGSRNVF